jgi:hypothetical protein
MTRDLKATFFDIVKEPLVSGNLVNINFKIANQGTNNSG